MARTARGTGSRAPTVLVLSGGGLRGLAHVGAWKAMLELAIRPDAIIGTSIGGFVGAAIASGLSLRRLVEVSAAVERKDIVTVDRRALWIRGVLRPSLFLDHVLRYTVARVLPWRSFQELPMALQLNAVNLTSGCMEWLGRSVADEDGARTDVPLVDAVCASCALPPYFPPVRIGDHDYVDGGVLDAFAIERAAALGAGWVIGVDVTGDIRSPDGPGPGLVSDADTGGAREDSSAALHPDARGSSSADPISGGMLAIADRAFGIVAATRRAETLRRWTDTGIRFTHIRPPVSAVPSFAFDRNEFLLDAGYRAAMAALEPLTGAEMAG